jgi:hypothetical protein
MPIAYLVSLLHKPLPVTVSYPSEVKLVSALAIAGLVRARIRPSANARGRYWPAEEAVVLCITEEGHEAITEHLLASTAQNEKESRKTPSPLEHLRKFEHSRFPLRVEDPKEIRLVAVLKAAGLVDATITHAPNLMERQDNYEQAFILRITPLGRAALDRIR